MPLKIVIALFVWKRIESARKRWLISGISTRCFGMGFKRPLVQIQSLGPEKVLKHQWFQDFFLFPMKGYKRDLVE